MIETKFVASKHLNRATLILLVIVLVYSYRIMFRKSQANTVSPGDKKLTANEQFLFARSHAPSDLDGTKVYYDSWEGGLLFYKYKFAEKGEKLELVRETLFSKNDKVLLSNDRFV